MVSVSQKATSHVAELGSGVRHPRGRRARHAAKAVRGTWDSFPLFQGKEVSVNKGNSEDIEMAVRKSDGA